MFQVSLLLNNLKWLKEIQPLVNNICNHFIKIPIGATQQDWQQSALLH